MHRISLISVCSLHPAYVQVSMRPRGLWGGGSHSVGPLCRRLPHEELVLGIPEAGLPVVYVEDCDVDGGCVVLDE